MSTFVIGLDFDGTLLDSQGHIHPCDLDILVTERRAVFIPATGRPLRSVRRAFARNGLFVDRPIPFPLVLLNGTALYGADEILQAEYHIAPDTRSALIDIMLRHPEVVFLMYGVHEIHVPWHDLATVQATRRFDLDVRLFTPAGPEPQLVKLTCISETPEPLQVLVEEAAGLPVDGCFSMPTALEFNPPGINKGSGLAALVHALQLNDPRVIAVGDGENDLPLFDVADLSFAPDASSPVVRARADYLVNVRDRGLLLPILETIGLR